MRIFLAVVLSFRMITISTQGGLEHELAPLPWSEDWDTCRCGKSSVSIAQETKSGQADGDILLHFENSTDNWRIRILFNQVIKDLRDTVGRKAECDKRACVLESKESNEERDKKVNNFEFSRIVCSDLIMQQSINPNPDRRYPVC